MWALIKLKNYLKNLKTHKPKFKMKFDLHIICFTFCTMYRYLTFVKFKVPILMSGF